MSKTPLSSQPFPDHFSGHACDYATFRPQYPQALYQYLANNCPQHSVAWDCATGNGQAALSLTNYFAKVLATDASAEQIAAATVHPKIQYSAKPAEKSGFADHSIDLVTVAQALHWFDLDAFIAEVERVVKPGGLLAAWSYELSSVDAEIDAVTTAIFDAVEDYWPPEREIVMNRYRDIEFPWSELAVPEFSMTVEWSDEQLLGYCRTWSASKRYLNDRGVDHVALHEAELRQAWGDSKRTVSWPLTIRVARL